MKMNKKSMTFNEFLGLVIAIALVFTFIIYPGSKLYAAFTKQEYINSYNKLTATIVDIGNSEKKTDSTSTDLIMDENTAIIAFPKDSNGIVLDLVSYDKKFKNVMEYLFSSTLVVKDVERARKYSMGLASIRHWRNCLRGKSNRSMGQKVSHQYS